MRFAAHELMELYPPRRIYDSSPGAADEFPFICGAAANCLKMPNRIGNDAGRMNWQDAQSNGAFRRARLSSQKETNHAEHSSGYCHTCDCARHSLGRSRARRHCRPRAASSDVVVTTPVEVDADGGIAYEQRPAFREYVVRERVPVYTVPRRVVVGSDAV